MSTLYLHGNSFSFCFALYTIGAVIYYVYCSAMQLPVSDHYIKPQVLKTDSNNMDRYFCMD